MKEGESHNVIWKKCINYESLCSMQEREGCIETEGDTVTSLFLLHLYVNFRQRQEAINLRAFYSIFIDKRLPRRDSNPQSPTVKAVVLPTEPPRQPSWLGSYHTS